MAFLGGDGGEVGLDAGEFGVGVGEDFVVGDGFDEEVGEVAAFAGGGALGGVLVGGGGIGFGFGEFGGGEAVEDGAADFLFAGGEGLFPIFGFGVHLEGGAFEVAHPVVGADGGGEEGAVGVFGEDLEAAVDDGVGQAADEVLAAGEGAVGAVPRGAHGFDADGDGAGFFFGEEAGFEALGWGDGAEVGIGGGAGGGFEAGELGGDDLGGEGGVDVAGDDDGDALWGIPFAVEVGEALAGGGFDDGFVADGEAAGDEGVGEGEFEALNHHAVVDVIAGELFAEDDAAFFVEFLIGEEHILGDVGEEEEALLKHGFGGFGEFEFVDGFFEGGVGVGVGAEGHAEALEEFDHFIGGVVSGAVEGHVFEEVGEALLVVGFHEGAGFDVDAGADFFGGFGVGEHGVADAVGEAAEDGFGVGLEVAIFLGPRGGGGGGILGVEEGGEAGKEEEKREQAGEFHGR